jgi:hypothetical protein
MTSFTSRFALSGDSSRYRDYLSIGVLMKWAPEFWF